MDSFDDEADLISVDHPAVVDNFRSAHGVFVRAQAQQASTEDLRSAMLHIARCSTSFSSVTHDLA